MIIFRLLGRTPIYEIRMSVIGTLNLDKIIEIFLYKQYPEMMKGYNSISKLSEDKRNIVFDKNPDIKVKLEKFESEKDEFVAIMRKVKFIHNGKMITMEEEINILNESQDYIICVFAQPDKTNVSSFVDKFFKVKGEVKKTEHKNDLSDSVLVGPIEPKVLKPEVLSDEKKKERFEDFKKLLNDKDFCTLLRIYLKKPQLFPALLAYVESGNIEKKKTKETDKVQISEKKYLEEIKTINQLQLNFIDNDILKVLIKRDGDMSLTLRDLLTNKVIESNQDVKESNQVVESANCDDI
jgi:hypothetical protein